MSLFALLFSRFQAHRSATPFFIGSLRSVSEGRRSMRVSSRPCFSLAACVGGFLSGTQPSSGALFANLFGFLQGHRSATPVVLGSQRSLPEGRRSMRLSGRSCFSLTAGAGGFLSGAQPASGTPFRPALARTPFRLASARVQRFAASAVLRLAPALSRHSRPFSAALVSRFVLQSHAKTTAPSSTAWANPALNLAPFSRWTRRDKAAPRRLALR